MFPERRYFVYLLASRVGGTLYVGVTNDVVRRVAEHKAGNAESFTRRYGVTRLVHFEEFGDIREAISREKAMKKWPRAAKIELIEARNPNWDDLLSCDLVSAKACRRGRVRALHRLVMPAAGEGIASSADPN